MCQHLLQRIHAQRLVHAGAVGQEGGQSCLEEKTKVEGVVALGRCTLQVSLLQDSLPMKQ